MSRSDNLIDSLTGCRIRVEESFHCRRVSQLGYSLIKSIILEIIFFLDILQDEINSSVKNFK